MIAFPLSLTYSALSAGLLLLWLVLYIVNKKGRKTQIRMSLLFCLFLPLELLYTHDYWHPATHLAIHVLNGYVGLEDIVFGFSFGGICASAVNFFVADYFIQKWYSVIIATLTIYLLSILIWMIGVNSIFATSSAALIIVLFYSLRRKEGAKRAVAGGIFALCIMFVVYAGGFFISSNAQTVLQSIWLLYGTSLGIQLLGVPLTELVWALSFGAFAAIL